MSYTLFLDLDGVLADFDRHVHNLTSRTADALDAEDRLWMFVGTQPNFWFDMPRTPYATEIWEVSKRIAFPRQPVILTGVPRTGRETAEAQKRQWVAQKLGSEVEVITCFSRDKQRHMRAPGDILLDDRVDNITRWRRAGGTAVLFRPEAPLLSLQALVEAWAALPRVEA